MRSTGRPDRVSSALQGHNGVFQGRTILDDHALIEHKNLVATRRVSQLTTQHCKCDSLVHDGRESMGNDQHGGARETLLDRLGDFGVHPASVSALPVLGSVRSSHSKSTDEVAALSQRDSGYPHPTHPRP